MTKTITKSMRWKSATRVLISAIALFAVSLTLTGAWAHGGEDHGDQKPAADSSVGPRVEATSESFEIVGIPSGAARIHHYLIDQDHTNVFTAWQKMGSPPMPSPDQYAALEKAGQLSPLGPPEDVKVHDATATLSLKLPRQAVALLVIEWNVAPD